MTWEQVQVQDGNSGQKTAVRMFKLGCWGFNTIISAWTTGSMCSMPSTITTQELGIHRIANHEQKYKHGSRCCWRLFFFLDRLVLGADFFVTDEILMKCCFWRINFLSPWSPCHLSTWQKKSTVPHRANSLKHHGQHLWVDRAKEAERRAWFPKGRFDLKEVLFCFARI